MSHTPVIYVSTDPRGELAAFGHGSTPVFGVWIAGPQKRDVMVFGPDGQPTVKALDVQVPVSETPRGWVVGVHGLPQDVLDALWELPGAAADSRAGFANVAGLVAGQTLYGPTLAGEDQ